MAEWCGVHTAFLRALVLTTTLFNLAILILKRSSLYTTAKGHMSPDQQSLRGPVRPLSCKCPKITAAKHIGTILCGGPNLFSANSAIN